MKHEIIERNKGGKGIKAWIQPVCLCGWVGSKHYAHNDYQYSNVSDQEKRHLRLSVKGIKR